EVGRNTTETALDTLAARDLLDPVHCRTVALSRMACRLRAMLARHQVQAIVDPRGEMRRRAPCLATAGLYAVEQHHARPLAGEGVCCGEAGLAGADDDDVGRGVLLEPRVANHVLYGVHPDRAGAICHVRTPVRGRGRRAVDMPPAARRGLSGPPCNGARVTRALLCGAPSGGAPPAAGGLKTSWRVRRLRAPAMPVEQQAALRRIQV